MRSKHAAIRREIKERMQAELEERKEEIKRRLKREDISVQEKRERYRREVHSEKLRLMEAAKQEFRARKRMLGEGAEQEDYGRPQEEEYAGASDEVGEAPDAAPEWHDEENMLVDDDVGLVDLADEVSPHEAFILETSEDEREARQEFEGPIDAYDALPPGTEQFGDSPPVFVHDIESSEIRAPNLFYYVWNLIFHPINTLDEFDDYIAFPVGIRNIAIFYLLSLLPIAIGISLTQSAGASASGEGVAGNILSSGFASPYGVAGAVGGIVLDLIVSTVFVAVFNYLFTSKFNFLTLLTYFAFVNAVSSVVASVAITTVALAAVFIPPAVFGSAIILLFISFYIWSFALRLIVLMSAYGYGLFSAFFLNLGAGFALCMGRMFM
jgi:hypothetical protein